MKKLAFAFVLLAVAASAADWKPVEGRIMTRWAEEVSPDKPLPEYPRPQLTRPDWVNLNGLWDYAVTSKNAMSPGDYQGEILVPFAIESALSGVGKAVLPGQVLWYRRTFEVPSAWSGNRVRLNFGAVDWHARVSVNGIPAGEHKGGYTPFSFDITDSLTASGKQELTLWVWDPTDFGTQARGKQVLEPQGIWYTAVTGIWQTVWIEPVGDISFERLRFHSDIGRGRVTLEALLSGRAGGARVEATVTDGGKQVASGSAAANQPLELTVPDAKLWSPDSPHLYDVRLKLTRNGETIDEVGSYFGMRKISIEADSHGARRLFLNNKALFQIGPLDQGWWPDGLYTAPSDEALKYDIEVTRELGFNMARKHVKVEPARWYYWCDRLGLMVWQDMPSAFLSGERDAKSLYIDPWALNDAPREGVSAAQFESEWKAEIDHFGFFPSIVAWVPFNEGWGQYDTGRIAEWTKLYDPTRLVNATSGWTDRGVGDFYDTHMYPGPGMRPLPSSDKRATVLGEFGGLGWPVEDHLWWNKRNWGYRTLNSRKELNDKYDEIVSAVAGPYHRGVSAAIYTQTTDVEGEVNGLMTYDRRLVKFDADQLKKIHGVFFAPPRETEVIAATSADQQQEWAYTFNEPSEGWAGLSLDDSTWLHGKAPLRSSADEQFTNGDVWATGPIWARRTFTVSAVPKTLWIEVMTSVSGGAIYLNGTEVAKLDVRTRREYRHIDVSRYAKLLKKGKNVLAIHADVANPNRETRRDLDAGLYTVK